MMMEESDAVTIPAKPSQPGRLTILLFGVPSLLIWGLVLRYAIPLLLHIVGLLPSAVGSENGGRVLYPFLVCLVALAGASLSVGMLSRAWKGKMPVWSTAFAFSLSLIGFLFVGSIGD